MRPLVLSFGISLLTLGVAWAQTSTGGNSTMQQLPVGQTFKNFEFPIYQEGKLKYTFNAAEATGITQNRAQASDVKIQLYDNGAVTTTVTSPKADLYVNERKMRSKDTVEIVRADMDATAQVCDFDLTNKKFLLRTNVKVILKNFDTNMDPNAKSKGPSNATPGGNANPDSSSTTPVSVSPPMAPRRSQSDQSLLDSPGAYSSTNSAPISPSSTDNK